MTNNIICRQCKRTMTTYNQDPRRWPRQGFAWAAMEEVLQDRQWHPRAELILEASATGLVVDRTASEIIRRAVRLGWLDRRLEDSSVRLRPGAPSPDAFAYPSVASAVASAPPVRGEHAGSRC